MEPLDAGQQRELDFVRSQRTGWPYRTARTRWTFAAGAVVVAVASIALLLGLGHGWWAWLGSACILAVTLAAVRGVLLSERALEATVRRNVPTTEAMKRGDRNRSGPG